MSITGMLSESTLLEGVDRATLRRIAEQGLCRQYQPGQTIVKQGDAASALYLLLSGKVRVDREHDGIVEHVVDLGQGAFFGEMALIEDHPRTASVTAVEPTECLLIVAWEFTALMHEFPRVTEALLRELITRVHRLEHHVF
jgi:CRP-like cAMP-binding protein